MDVAPLILALANFFGRLVVYQLRTIDSMELLLLILVYLNRFVSLLPVAQSYVRCTVL